MFIKMLVVSQPFHNIYSNVNIPETPDTGSNPKVLDYYFYALQSIGTLLALRTLLAKPEYSIFDC